MDVHDIRYLHNESVSEEGIDADLNSPNLFTKRNIIGGAAIGFLAIAIGLVSFAITKQTSTTSSAQNIQADVTISPEPTKVEVGIKGTIICLPTKTQSSIDECTLALKGVDGKIYILQNVQYADVARGTLVPGNEVNIRGVTTGIDVEASLYIISVSSNAPGSTSPTALSIEDSTLSPPTPSPSSPQHAPTVTPTHTPTPTPTPIPHFLDSTPQPGVSYVSVQYIRDHAQELAGTQVDVGAYLVGGYIGSDGCSIFGICGYSIFYLADTNDPNRDLNEDIVMTGDVSEKEEDYTTGQNYYHKVTVIVAGVTVSLAKVY
ncbi:MAG: hypothetical protein HYV40_02725 [Candidatus Levybacteria bacterium]|nr:hypothetical protein [Candidatus Levybacteria bacterium]